MPISLTCDCGRALRLKDELAGRKIRCPSCNVSLTVPKPETSAEDEALDILLGDAPAARPDPDRVSAESGIQTEEPRRPAPVRAEPPRPVSTPKPPAKPSKRRPARGEDESGGRRFGIAVNGQIILGGVMLLGAVALGLLGLLNGYILFGSISLFVWGIVNIARGFRGED